MSDIAIRVENVSKLFKLGPQKRTYRTMSETLTEAALLPFREVARLFQGTDGRANEGNDTIWALKDVSAEIKQGEVVGIIGRNGAGKSTLLKILSRITEPTEGYAEIHGRVGSLLEVGTGFHQELTGRENVYLNGAILGMKKAEIDRKFDEIVDFAEVERFIDTPVKHYSSGMTMRLAFAVAAHLQPEILLVDEVLAVGDVRFQKKCLNKMESVSEQGRTVLFVSHNMAAVTRLCERSILLGDGTVIKEGHTYEVVGAYLNSGLGTTAAREWTEPATAPRGEIVRLRAVRVRTEDGSISDVVDIRCSLTVEMEYEVLKPGFALMPHFSLHNAEGLNLFSAHDLDPRWRKQSREVGRYTSIARIPGNFLAEGTMFVSPGCVTVEPTMKQFYERAAVAFQVVDTSEGDSARGDWGREMRGAVRPMLKWCTEYCPLEKTD